jgi:hypothetical protein
MESKERVCAGVCERARELERRGGRRRGFVA